MKTYQELISEIEFTKSLLNRMESNKIKQFEKEIQESINKINDLMDFMKNIKNSNKNKQERECIEVIYGYDMELFIYNAYDILNKYIKKYIK